MMKEKKAIYIPCWGFETLEILGYFFFDVIDYPTIQRKLTADSAFRVLDSSDSDLVYYHFAIFRLT